MPAVVACQEAANFFEAMADFAAAEDGNASGHKGRHAHETQQDNGQKMHSFFHLYYRSVKVWISKRWISKLWISRVWLLPPSFPFHLSPFPPSVNP